jgi:hypothetical protein
VSEYGMSPDDSHICSPVLFYESLLGTFSPSKKQKATMTCKLFS